MSPAVIMLLCLLVLGVAGLGVRQVWIDFEERRALIRRSALTRVEARASTLRYRIDAALRRTRLGERVASELRAVGLPLSVLAAMTIVVSAVVLGFVVLDRFVPTWLAPLGAYGAWRLVRFQLERQRQRRRDEFVTQLPELARTISNAASAGRSLPSAMRLAARELEDPAGTELAAVAEELRIGQSLDRALQNLSQRLPSREVEVMVTTLLIQQRAGGDLVQALREMARTLDQRKDLRSELRSLMAGAVYTGYVVMGLGVGAVLLMNAITPGALDTILSSAMGIVATTVAVGLYAVGVVLIRRHQTIDI